MLGILPFCCCFIWAMFKGEAIQIRHTQPQFARLLTMRNCYQAFSRIIYHQQIHHHAWLPSFSHVWFSFSLSDVQGSAATFRRGVLRPFWGHDHRNFSRRTRLLGCWLVSPAINPWSNIETWETPRDRYKPLPNHYQIITEPHRLSITDYSLPFVDHGRWFLDLDMATAGFHGAPFDWGDAWKNAGTGSATSKQPPLGPDGDADVEC